MENISLFKNFTKEIGRRCLSQIVQGIRGVHYKEIIFKIRKAIENNQKEEADRMKKTLLGFTVSGMFEGWMR